MQDEQNTVVEAFTLARSGRFTTVSDIQRELQRSGFPGAGAHLSGLSIKQQLRALITESRSRTSPPNLLLEVE